MSQDCPFCPEEAGVTSTGWGYSPEGWRQAKEKHDKNHTVKCPTCGQPIATKTSASPN